MEISKYQEKLNKLEHHIYVIEEEVTLKNGQYEGKLRHDNINDKTVSVYSGKKLSGERIENYVLSTPSDAPWTRIIRIYTTYPTVYISYETEGDTVEAEDINRLQEDMVKTQEALNEEIERACDAEEALKTDLETEISRAKKVEKKLTDDLAAEIKRASDKENKIISDLKAEEERATNAENTVQEHVDAETLRAKAAETVLSNELNLEVERATNAETALQNNLNVEVTRAKEAEKNLSEKLSDEIARASDEEDTLKVNLEAETKRAVAAENALEMNLNAEIARAKATEKTNADAISTEKSRAIAKENEIAANLDFETTRATNAESTLQGNINTESNRAKTAEKKLTDDLSAEIVRSTSAENTLTKNLNTEVERATASEKKLTDDLDTEIVRAKGAESANTTAVNNETARAKGEEKILADNLTSEISRAKAAEKVNADAIVTEKNRAIAAENTKAPLASPVLTGVPTAPTASAGTNTIQIATTAFTQTAVSNHNSSSSAHADIRNLISGLTTRLNTLADSDDTTLDQMSEVVAYIKNNKNLIDGITTSKVNVADIINTLTSTATNKPLSANQGKILKDLIDALTATVSTKASNADVTAHTGNITVHITSTERTNWNDANSKKHTHDNKTVIDGITSALITAWNSAVTHISDAVKHITAAERTLWNTVSNKVDKVSGKGLSTNDLTAALKANYDSAYAHSTSAHAPSNAEANQNAFSSVKVGATTVTADTKTDTLELVAGNNVTLTPDATNDKVTITSKDTTYSDATISTHGLMTADMVAKLNGISTGANSYTHPTSHPATMITEDASHRFVTDTEKSKWNNKSDSGHTHNYAGSASAGGAATKAIGVADYGDTNRTIKIGYNGSGATTSNLAYIAGYLTDGNQIKDVSKDVLKSWLGSMPASDVYDWAKASNKPSYAWSEITSKPSTFAPSAHNQDWSTITGKPSTFSPSSHTHNTLNVVDTRDANPAPNSSDFQKRMVAFDFKNISKIGSPAGFAGNYCGLMSLAPWSETSGGNGYQMGFGYDSNNTVPRLALRTANLSAAAWGSWYKIYTSADKPTLSDIGAASSSHTHDDRYYTESEMDSKLSGKAPTSHTHTKSQITDFPAIPTVGNGTVTITQNGTTKGTFTMNQSGNTTIALSDTNTDNNTTYSASTGLTLSGTAFSVKYGTAAGTACQGNDSRLSNARPASDVSSWAKAATKPSYAWSEITGKPSTFAPSSHEHDYALSNQNCSNKDFNTLMNTGFYYGYQNMTNAAIANDISVLEVLRYSNDWIVQRQTTINDNPKTYERVKTKGTTWSTWYRVYTSVDKPTPSEIGASTSGHTHNYAGSSSAGGAATKAVQDSDGKQINTTYVKKGCTWGQLMGV